MRNRNILFLISVNGLASILGMLQQALTAPLFLLMVPVSDFASWISFTSVAFFVSLSANGFYYTILNEVVIAFSKARYERARGHFTLGYLGILVLGAAAVLTLFGCNLLWGLRWDDKTSVYIASIFSAILSLQYILVDAAFRSSGRMSKGIWVLTWVRAVDWISTLIFLFFTRNIVNLVYLVAICRVAVFPILYWISIVECPQLKMKSARIKVALGCRALSIARWQTLISLSTACNVVGPQFVATTFLNPELAVTFLVTRTYLRLANSIAAVINVSIWPQVTRTFAKSRNNDSKHLIVQTATVGGATCIATILMLAMLIRPIFTILYHGKIQVDVVVTLLAAISVALVSVSSIVQQYFVSTNRSNFLLASSSILNIAMVAAIAVPALSHNLYLMMSVQICFEVAAMICVWQAFRLTDELEIMRLK